MIKIHPTHSSINAHCTTRCTVSSAERVYVDDKRTAATALATVANESDGPKDSGGARLTLCADVPAKRDGNRALRHARKRHVRAYTVAGRFLPSRRLLHNVSRSPVADGRLFVNTDEIDIVYRVRACAASRPTLYQREAPRTARVGVDAINVMASKLCAVPVIRNRFPDFFRLANKY